MRYWTISYPSKNTLGEPFVKYETLTDTDVLDRYWDTWSGHMLRWYHDKRLLTGESDGLEIITPEKCIEDWSITHRAERNVWREMKECIA